VTRDEVDAVAMELVERLAAGPTVSLGLTKWSLLSGSSLPLEGHLRNEAFGLEISARSEDFREGLAALQERRKPEFRGR
jgi:2-(1,2-epoxy-1,2-dihydrophenyl)acetyl-CoA isomerase